MRSTVDVGIVLHSIGFEGMHGQKEIEDAMRNSDRNSIWTRVVPAVNENRTYVTGELVITAYDMGVFEV